MSVTLLSQGLPVATSISPLTDDGTIRWFGWDIAGGDFNGDGIGDIAIGAPRSDRPITHPYSALNVAGRVDIYFGPIPTGDHDGTTLPPDLIIYGADSAGQLGISVSNAGDFNGDGFDDLLVGANAVRSVGEAYIFLGGPLLDIVPDYTFSGLNPADNFGYSSTGIGDQNDDGYDDIMVSSLYNDAIGPRTGQAYIFYGGAPTDTMPDFIITGLDSLDDFGVDIEGPFDFNDDDSPDFVVGAVQAGGYWYKPGEGYVFYGGALLDNVPDWTVSGGHPMEFFASSVAALGDVDRDGYDDALYGGYNHHIPPDSGLGHAILLLGGTGDTISLVGDTPGQLLGGEVGPAGDIDGDNRAEFAIAQAIDGNGDEFGFVKIYGVTTLPDSSRVIQVDTVCYNPGARDDTWFAYRMLTIGDVNVDTFPDFAITDPRIPNEPGLYEAQGRVYIYHGWRVLFPIYAEFIEPDSTVSYSACERQGATIRLRQEFGLEGLSVNVLVESDSADQIYTLDSIQLDMIDDSTLVFNPSRDWNHEEFVVVTLTSASLPTGEELFEPVSVSWKLDLQPPSVRALNLQLPLDDPYPVFYWIIGNRSDSSYIDMSDAFIYSNGDTANPEYIEDITCSGYQRYIVAASLSELGLRADYDDSATVCIAGVHDDPDIPCGPNYATPVCQTRYFIRNWTADLTFTSPGLDATTLTIGALPGMTDSYDPGGDIIMPPIPASKVKARLSLVSEGIPAYNSLLRDLRDAYDDTIRWVVVTQGDGNAELAWNPDRLPTGMFFVEKRDMRSSNSYKFNLGDTLTLTFSTGPKAIESMTFITTSPRWQMVSSPLYLDQGEMSHYKALMDSIYPDLERWIYTYNTETGVYNVPDKWPTGKGLWFFLDRGVGSSWTLPLAVAGWPMDTLHIPVYSGWNQIGAPSLEVPSSMIDTEPSGAIISGTLFGYGPTDDYYAADALSPGNGYWILCDTAAELMAPRGTRSLSKSIWPKALIEKFGKFPPPPPNPVEEISKPGNYRMSISPNPFNTACEIILPDDLTRDILIIDISGRIVRRFNRVEGRIMWDGKDDFERQLPSGVYLIETSDAKAVKAILLR